MRLITVGTSMIKTIKYLREVFPLGLKEAKDLWDRAKYEPVTLCYSVPYDTARSLSTGLTLLGNTVVWSVRLSIR